MPPAKALITALIEEKSKLGDKAVLAVGVGEGHHRQGAPTGQCVSISSLDSSLDCPIRDIISTICDNLFLSKRLVPLNWSIIRLYRARLLYWHFSIRPIYKLFAILCKQSHPALQNMYGWKMPGNGHKWLIGLIWEVADEENVCVNHKTVELNSISCTAKVFCRPAGKLEFSLHTFFESTEYFLPL